MKNQSFHQRKIRIQETPKLDFEQLRTRTVNALNKLGQQKFSPEPGGYALENWIKGVDVLLDEFEEKVGAARLTPEYLASRHGLKDRLSKPVSTSSIDEESARLRASMIEIEGKVEAERVQTGSKISGLKAEQARCAADLERERRQTADSLEIPNANSFFSRLLGRSRAPANDPESRISELEMRLAALTNELLAQQQLLKKIDLRSPESQFAEDWKKLDSMQTRLNELETERLDKVQLVKERVELTGSIADAISRIT